MNKWKHAAVLMSVMLLGACANLSNLNDDGTADELVWPIVSERMIEKGGVTPNFNNLIEIREGLTRQQVYHLIGAPHFKEGFRVREWDYLFRFPTPNQGVNGETVCQFKILFDKDKRVRSGYWRAVEPKDAACLPSSEQQ